MRICVVRLGGMGDILLSTPTLRALSQHFGTQEIDYIVDPRNAEAVSGLPYIRRVLLFRKREDMRREFFVPFLKQLHAARYDLFLNFQPSVRTELMMLASGAKRRIRFYKDQRVQRSTRQLRHAIDDFAKEVLPLGVEVTSRQMDFFIPEEAHTAAEALLATAGIAPGQRFVAINPGASHAVNRWPVPYFIELFAALKERHPDVGRVVLGGPGDLDIANAVAESSAGVANLAGKMQFKELGAVLTRASVLVTGDTGPQHVAAAVGTPLVSLFGPADPNRTGPIGVPALVVVNTELSCVPCRSRTCHRGDNACMRDLAMERVLAAVEKQLA